MQKDLILIIEDDDNLRESTTAFLREEGFEVMEAPNGVEGLKRIREHFPSLVLCDISMPEMNGYEVYQSMHQNEQTSLIPFIFFTAKAEKDDIRTGMQLGADDYITKPFDLDELLNSIRIRLEKFRRISKIYQDPFDLIFENSLMGMALIKDGMICETNARFSSMLEYKPETLSGKTVESIFVKEDFERMASKFEKCYLGALRRFSEKCRLLTKEDRQIPVQFFVGKLTNSISGNLVAIIKELGTEETETLTGNNDSETLDALVNYLVSNKHRLNETHVKEITSAFEKKSKSDDRIISLTKRETEILELICKGLTNQEIGEKLFISSRTVETHRANLIEKTGSANAIELVVFALRNGIITF